MNLDLVDSIKLVLNGILGCDDLRFGAMDLQQAAIERRRLTTTSWSRDQNDAVRKFD